MFQPTRLKPLFHPGKLLIAPAAIEALRSNSVPVLSVVLRHIAGDWGVVSEDDKRQNDVSIVTGLRLISIYRLPDQTRILVITEWDRSNTTIERLADVVPSSNARASQSATRRYPAWPKAEYSQEGRA
ncbi:hypothetical protein [Burkholderia vietnamiensis]|uniref:Plasmid related protein n=1 Tax=Burkholderia vietnamiensis TaxID=60552 RepID=A0AAW7T5V4_BURVI|nr:hypothetical protein [Burkholderia vietnamiensis]MDN7797251.1 hypothetical protein [Burkholderia vietnamiensis]HDR9192151.1 hypothetical protein [Burkholderia vietnamiensis]